jgi:hypothetical protein
MSRQTTDFRNDRISRLMLLLGACGAGCSLGTAAFSGEGNPGSTLDLTYTVQVVGISSPTSDSTCPVKQLVEGAGLTNLLGTVHDEQSDCLHADGTVDQGVFTFHGATLGGGLPGGDDSADSITGQYRAHLVPSIASVPSNPPAGFWLIYGEVCIEKGTGKFSGVVNDCPTSGSPGRYFPARLTIDLATGQANIFGTAKVRVAD